MLMTVHAAPSIRTTSLMSSDIHWTSTILLTRAAQRTRSWSPAAFAAITRMFRALRTAATRQTPFCMRVFASAQPVVGVRISTTNNIGSWDLDWTSHHLRPRGRRWCYTMAADTEIGGPFCTSSNLVGYAVWNLRCGESISDELSPGATRHVSGGQKIRFSGMKRAAHKRTREDRGKPHVPPDVFIFYKLLGRDVPDQLSMLA